MQCLTCLFRKVRLSARVTAMVAALMAIASGCPGAFALEYLYVALGNNTVMRYDVSSNVGTTIQSTAFTFANTNLNDPQGIVMDNGGNLYVANNSTITKYNSSGVFQSSISSNLSNPRGLAIDSTGRLYASNSGNNTITRYTSAGVFDSTFVSSNLNSPAGLMFDSGGNLLVANTNGNSIRRYNASGTLVSSITTNLNQPWGLASNSGGNIFASNQQQIDNIFRVSRFNSSGTFVSYVQSNVNSPRGIGFDLAGNFYVANFNNNTISKYDSNLVFVTSWSTPSNPRGLIVHAPEPSTYVLALVSWLVLGLWCRSRPKSGRRLTTANR